MFEKLRRTFVPAATLWLLTGCSNSTNSIPESIRLKAQTARNEYSDAMAGQKSPITSDPVEGTKTHVIQPHETWSMRQTASFALGRIGPAAVPSLVQMLRNPDVTIKRQAIETLSRIGPEAAHAVPELTYALQDPDPLVRKMAARALGQIGPAAADAVPALIHVFQQPSE